MDYLVVGAGFAGSVCAQQLAAAGRKVLVIDRREHIAGNAFDRLDEHGVLVHEYGPHIFHTNSSSVFEYLSQFTEWRSYEHRVLAAISGKTFPIPINRTTINSVYGLNLDEKGVAEYLERVREPRAEIRTSEDVVLSSVGSDLCEKFFRGYTKKQWNLDLSELSAGVAARIPTRTNDDDRYFTDRYQAMPLHGYTKMFERMLDHSNIEVRTGVCYSEVHGMVDRRATIYTGALDEYFGYCFGRLPYRSLRFEHQHFRELGRFQEVGTVNYPSEHELFTRITEFKHLTGQVHSGTSIVKEYPCSDGDPYYPVPNPKNELLFKRYEALAQRDQDVYFIGRLAQYRYYNMDQVVGAAIVLTRDILRQADSRATVQ